MKEKIYYEYEIWTRYYSLESSINAAETLFIVAIMPF